MKIKICDNPLDLEKASSILFVGKCGTGKTRTIKEILRDYLPINYDGYGIHTIKEMRIEYQGDKFDVRAGKVVEALVELMERMSK